VRRDRRQSLGKGCEVKRWTGRQQSNVVHRGNLGRQGEALTYPIRALEALFVVRLTGKRAEKLRVELLGHGLASQECGTDGLQERGEPHAENECEQHRKNHVRNQSRGVGIARSAGGADDRGPGPPGIGRKEANSIRLQARPLLEKRSARLLGLLARRARSLSAT
jgi:hypothetical protein